MKEIFRYILAIVFISSGIMKSIDPYGVSLTVAEYLRWLQIPSADIMNEIIAVGLCIFETGLGFMLFHGMFKRVISIITFLLICAFTILIECIINDPYDTIQECGCFGNIISLSMEQTFYKNIVLLVLSIPNVYYSFKYSKCDNHLGIHRIVAFSFAVILPVYSLFFLPIGDFLDYNLYSDLNKSNKFMVLDKNIKLVKDSLLSNNEYHYFFITKNNVDNHIHKNIKSSVDNYTCDLLSSNEMSKEYFISDYERKSIVRADEGVIAVQNSKIVGKWSKYTFPFFLLKYFHKGVIPVIIQHVVLIMTTLIFIFAFIFGLKKDKIKNNSLEI